MCSWRSQGIEPARLGPVVLEARRLDVAGDADLNAGGHSRAMHELDRLLGGGQVSRLKIAAEPRAHFSQRLRRRKIPGDVLGRVAEDKREAQLFPDPDRADQDFYETGIGAMVAAESELHQGAVVEGALESREQVVGGRQAIHGCDEPNMIGDGVRAQGRMQGCPRGLLSQTVQSGDSQDRA